METESNYRISAADGTRDFEEQTETETEEKYLCLKVRDLGSFGVEVRPILSKGETGELIGLLTNKYKELWPEEK